MRILSDPQVPYPQWFANTILVASITAIGTVFLGGLAAYSFSRMRFTGRRFGLISIVIVQMFPQLLAVVAIFLLMSSIADWFPAIGLNTHVGLIMVYLGGALGVNTFLMYGFFNTIPASIDEAAKIDGAGHARIFFTIILRLAAPILAVVALLSFIFTVNEFVVASVLLIDTEKQTLAVGPHEARVEPAVRGLECLLGGCGDGRAAGRGAVPLAAEVHRRRPHRRRRQVVERMPHGAASSGSAPVRQSRGEVISSYGCRVRHTPR